MLIKIQLREQRIYIKLEKCKCKVDKSMEKRENMKFDKALHNYQKRREWAEMVRKRKRMRRKQGGREKVRYFSAFFQLQAKVTIIAFIHPQFPLDSLSLQANMYFPLGTAIFSMISDHFSSVNASAQLAVEKQNDLSPLLDLNNRKFFFGSLNHWYEFMNGESIT